MRSSWVDRPPIELDGMVQEGRAYDGNGGALLLHIITPAPSFTDRGKTLLSASPKIKDAIRRTVAKVLDRHRKAVKAEEAGQRKPKRKAKKEMSKKAAVLKVLPEALAGFSHIKKFDARSLYYAARPLIQRFCPGDMSQNYFESLVDCYEETNGLIPNRMRDPRGYFLEPHSGKQISLGTEAVEKYEFPEHQFKTVIYVEKKGLLSAFQHGKIAERYDCGIICAEGFANRASQHLMQLAQRNHGMKIVVFHDADPAGYLIANKIGKKSGAHDFDYEVFDAGLHLDEALELGLETETFTRKKALPSALKLTDIEREYFTGTAVQYERNSKPRTRWENCRRVELNALAAFPDRFVEFVESKLERAGASRKLIPKSQVCHAYLDEQLRQLIEGYVRSELESELALNSLVADVTSELDVEGPENPRRLIADALKQEPTMSWRRVAEKLAEQTLDARKKHIYSQVRKHV